MPLVQNTGSPSQFANGQTTAQTFTYDNERDFLTAANYNDGYSSASVTWDYDAEGNRTTQSCTYDVLNRQTACSTFNYTSDALGNRTSRFNTANNANVTYTWDEMNRLTAYNSWEYAYRADGMRVSKYHSASSNARTLYKYDGQMGFEDMEIANTGGSISKMVYGLGARGLDLLEKVSTSGTTTVFPLYDCHGNNVASLSRSGASYALADQRIYDAWGRVRNTTATGDPRSRYVANLGHKYDDESDLIYMRARYYEPLRGRFISQDQRHSGGNWFTYCSNDPVSKSDPSGGDEVSDFFKQGQLFSLLGVLWAAVSFKYFSDGVLSTTEAAAGLSITVICACFAVYNFCEGLGGCDFGAGKKGLFGFFAGITVGIAAFAITALSKAFESLGGLARCYGIVGISAATACASYLAQCTAALIMIGNE
jgi:RHS repeat-associated protein